MKYVVVVAKRESGCCEVGVPAAAFDSSQEAIAAVTALAARAYLGHFQVSPESLAVAGQKENVWNLFTAGFSLYQVMEGPLTEHGGVLMGRGPGIFAKPEGLDDEVAALLGS